MKNILYFLAFIFIAGSTQAQYFPKKCVSYPEKQIKKPYIFSAPIVDVKIRKASISAITIPVTMGQGIYKDGTFTVSNSINVGGAYIFGAADVQVLKDSAVYVAGMTYYGLSFAYGAQSVFTETKASFLVGPIVGFNSFALMPAYDVISSGFVIGITYNLAGLPFLHNFVNIKLQ